MTVVSPDQTTCRPTQPLHLWGGEKRLGEGSTAFLSTWAAAASFPHVWPQEDRTTLMTALRTSNAREVYMPIVVKWMVEAASNQDTDERALIVMLGSSILAGE